MRKKIADKRHSFTRSALLLDVLVNIELMAALLLGAAVIAVVELPTAVFS